jgi:hypothetical protein
MTPPPAPLPTPRSARPTTRTRCSPTTAAAPNTTAPSAPPPRRPRGTNVDSTAAAPPRATRTARRIGSQGLRRSGPARKRCREHKATIEMPTRVGVVTGTGRDNTPQAGVATDHGHGQSQVVPSSSCAGKFPGATFDQLLVLQ